MADTGFLQQRSNSPLGLGTVLLLHAAAIAGILTIRTQFVVAPSDPIDAETITIDDPPLPETLPERPAEPQPQPQAPRSQIDVPPPVVPQSVPGDGPAVIPGPLSPPGQTVGEAELPDRGAVLTPDPTPPARPPQPVPVRREAQFEAGAPLQPPYPTVEQRNEREGSVQVRVTIGANGRVTAISRLSATSDAFWRATERHALARWRFRPATEDGRPVESSRTLTVHFELND